MFATANANSYSGAIRKSVHSHLTEVGRCKHCIICSILVGAVQHVDIASNLDHTIA